MYNIHLTMDYDDDDKYREIHKISAYTAVASYSFAMISIIINF